MFPFLEPVDVAELRYAVPFPQLAMRTERFAKCRRRDEISSGERLESNSGDAEGFAANWYDR